MESAGDKGRGNNLDQSDHDDDQFASHIEVDIRLPPRRKFRPRSASLPAVDTSNVGSGIFFANRLKINGKDSPNSGSSSSNEEEIEAIRFPVIDKNSSSKRRSASMPEFHQIIEERKMNCLKFSTRKERNLDNITSEKGTLNLPNLKSKMEQLTADTQNHLTTKSNRKIYLPRLETNTTNYLCKSKPYAGATGKSSLDFAFKD